MCELCGGRAKGHSVDRREHKMDMKDGCRPGDCQRPTQVNGPSETGRLGPTLAPSLCSFGLRWQFNRAVDKAKLRYGGSVNWIWAIRAMSAGDAFEQKAVLDGL